MLPIQRLQNGACVFAGLRRIAVVREPMHAATYPRTETVHWRVPSPAPKGRLQFCVDAVDPAGNKSPSSCAPFTLR